MGCHTPVSAPLGAEASYRLMILMCSIMTVSKKVESGATLWRIPSDAVEAGGGGGGESAPQPLQELMTLPNNEGVVGAIKGTHWHPSEDGKLLSLHDNALQIWDLNAELSSGVCERSMNWQSRGYMCSLVAWLRVVYALFPNPLRCPSPPNYPARHSTRPCAVTARRALLSTYNEPAVFALFAHFNSRHSLRSAQQILLPCNCSTASSVLSVSVSVSASCLVCLCLPSSELPLKSYS